MRPSAFNVLALAAAFAAVGCVGDPVERRPRGIEGIWISADGVASSRFSAGRFETTLVASGQRVTHGTWRMLAPDQVEIEVLSARGQPVSRITCLGAASAQLSCSTASGQPFTLTRIG